MPVYEDEQPPAGFSLSAVRAFLWRQRLILIGVTALALIIGLIVTLLMTPTYTASASMRVEGTDTQIVAGQDVASGGPPARGSAERYLSTLTNLMYSRGMALQVADELDLQDNRTILSALDEENFTSMAPEDRRKLAAGVLTSNVQIANAAGSEIVTVSYTSEDRELAAQVANAYVDTFIRNDATEATGSNAYALSYLEEQIADVRSRLQQAERQAINYARANGVISEPITGPAPIDGSGGVGVAPTVTVSNLASANQNYTQARAARIAAEQRWNSVASIAPLQLPEVQQSPTVQALRTQQAQLRGELSDLQERYRQDYPEIVEINAQIAELERQIQQEGALIKNGIRQDYVIAQRQEQALGGELDRVSQETLDEQDRRVEYNIIDRDADALRNQLQALLARYNDISSASDVRRTAVSELDRALPPTVPTSPNLLLNLALSLVAGLGLAGTIAILREFFDDRIRSTDDLEYKLSLPALGKIPYVTEDISDEVVDPFSPISESYSSIRASLDQSIKRPHPVIQFTSSEPGEGKSTSAMALARKYASSGRRVLLVDFDLRRPGVAKFFGIEQTEVGLMDVLHSRLPLEKALHASGIEKLDFLPLGQIPENPVEVMSSNLIPQFIERYREQYDVILLDSSPVMGIADAPLLARRVDGVVFVVEANRAQFGKVKVALRRLQDMDGRVVGGILTKFRALEVGEDYKSQYQYYTYNSKTV